MAMQFAFMLVPILGAFGFAIDYARMMSTRDELQNAVDAASLAMSSKAQQQLNAGQTPTTASIVALGSTQFSANLSGYASRLNPTTSFSYTLVGNQISTRATFSVNYPMLFSGLLSDGSWTVTGQSSSVSQTTPYIDVYLLVDQSGSMALGATTADINALNAKTGCAFACHDNNNWIWSKGRYVDAYNWALDNNIQMKLQVINQGVLNFIQYIGTVDPQAVRVRIALYSFDTGIYTLQPITYSRTSIQNNLPSAPAASDEYAGATLFNENISQMLATVGTAGDGSAQSKSKKVFILATDGVQDPTRSWTWNTPLRAKVAPFDFSFCTTMKSRGVTVGIINTGYLPMTWDWGYNATVGAQSLIAGTGTRHDDIVPLMKTCAGAQYVDGSNSANLVNGFSTIFASATATARVSN